MPMDATSSLSCCGAVRTPECWRLTAYARGAHARRALDLGVAGVFGRDAPLSSVYTAIRGASASKPMVCPVALLDAPPSVALTPREHEVLQQLGLGHDATRIANALGISLHTTRGYIKAVMRKLGVQTQLHAVVTAERLGLLRMPRQF
jgi:DNA-binding NarL/FixJ family response regulator